MKGKAITVAMLILFISALGLAFSEKPIKGNQDSGYTKKGQKLFLQYCASCHGNDGKGQGPVSIALKGGPRDLTLIQAPDTEFPVYRVQTVIDGERDVSAHGTRRMPVWGAIFRKTNGELQKEVEIYALVKYIESIQQHGRK